MLRCARGQGHRTKILVPDSAHGTNPATTTMSGLEVVEIPSDADGNVDMEALKAELGDDVVGLMITNPSTLGLFEQNIVEICDLVHEAGGLVYGDGANLNAIMGITRPGDLGIDVMHFNLHKTFSTPHGGGGPGSGPVGVTAELAPFLPGPLVALDDEGYQLVLAGTEYWSGAQFPGQFRRAGASLHLHSHARRRGLAPSQRRRGARTPTTSRPGSGAGRLSLFRTAIASACTRS